MQTAVAFEGWPCPVPSFLETPYFARPPCGKGPFLRIPSHLQALALLLWVALLSALQPPAVFQLLTTSSRKSSPQGGLGAAPGFLSR